MARSKGRGERGPAEGLVLLILASCSEYGGRSDALNKRRVIMQAWAEHCG
jgi:hypothetical protein